MNMKDYFRALVDAREMELKVTRIPNARKKKK